MWQSDVLWEWAREIREYFADHELLTHGLVDPNVPCPWTTKMGCGKTAAKEARGRTTQTNYQKTSMKIREKGCFTSLCCTLVTILQVSYTFE